jgi:hypothetical protein
MENDEQYLDLFEEYYFGEMTEESRSVFEQRLENDVDFAEAYAVFKKLQAGLKDEGRRNFAHALQNAQAELEKEFFFEEQTPAKVRRLPLRRILAVAASVAILLVVAWRLWPDTRSGEQLFAQHFNLDTEGAESYASGRGFAGEADADLLNAIADIQNQDFTAARARLEEIQNAADPTDMRDQFAQLLQAQLDLRDQRTAQALPALSELAANDNFPDQTAARWFLGLAYLQGGNRRQARQTFQLLTNDPFWGEKAQEVMDDLN